MPARHSPRSALALCLAGLVCLTWAGPAARADPAGTPAPRPAGPAADASGLVRLSLPQAQALAQAALRKGQPKTAFTLTQGLLKANPGNGHAHFIRAHALGQMKQYRTASLSAARAYRVARTDMQRFEAAKLAAQLNFAGEQLTSSQIWLRRTVHYAPDAATRDTYVKAFRKVRHTNPLRFHLSFSINPSDNVNNGANSPWNIIEGSPLVGTLSPSARAIDGLVAKTDAQGAYRLRQGEGYETHLTARALSREIRFDDPVPGISGADISSLRAEVGLRHLWAPGEGGHWRADLSAGRAWYGGSPYYDFAGLGLSRSQKLGENTRLTLGAHIETQADQAPPITADAMVYSAFTGLSQRLPGGGRLGAQIRVREIDSEGTNRSSQQWSGVISYTLGREIGPARISLSAGYSTLDYDQYWVILPIPGGRVDTSWFGGVTASFTDYSYMGFVPVLSVNSEKSRSNISRFDVDQTAVSFGIRSEF